MKEYNKPEITKEIVEVIDVITASVSFGSDLAGDEGQAFDPNK